jgi:hypothetical protein
LIFNTHVRRGPAPENSAESLIRNPNQKDERSEYEPHDNLPTPVILANGRRSSRADVARPGAGHRSGLRGRARARFEA